MAGNKFLQIPQVQSDVTVQNVTTVGERETLLQAPAVQNSSQECQVVMLGDSNRFMNAPSISDITYAEENPVQACSIDYGVYGNGSIEKDPIFKASPAYLITMADISNWNNLSAGSVIGPAGSINDDIVLFNGITGSLIKDSGYKLTDFSLSSHTHTGVYQPVGNYSTDIHSNITALNSVSGTNTGDNSPNSLYSGLVTNATHTGEVTGATALTVDKTIITNKTIVTITGSDYILFSDTSDSGDLKKGLVSDIVTDISGKEDVSNKVTSISSGSTDVQYPSAKLLYDQLALKQVAGTYSTDIHTNISALNLVSGTNTGNQALTIGGTTSPTIALSDSNTATFVGAGSVSLNQSGGTITITGGTSMTWPAAAGIALYNGSSAWGTSITDNSVNWNTAYSNRISSFTTTGSSGAASFTSNILNIPNYTLAGLGGVPYTGAISAVDLGVNNFTVDTSTLFVDSVNHRVGIGIIAPVSILDIKATTTYEAPTLSAEFLTGTGWTSTGWTGSWVGGWIHTPGNTSALSYPTAAVNVTKYEISYTVTGRTLGSFTIAFGGQSISSLTATDTWGPTTSTTGNLVITPTSDFDGNIVISIKSITAVRNALVSYTSSTGVVLRELRIDLANPTNQFDGYGSGRYNTSGTNNTGYGYLALSQVTSGYSNTGIGREALRDLTTGSYNMALGNLSGTYLTTGSKNIGVGTGSIFALITGNYNVGIGYNAVRNGTSSSGNVGIGYYSVADATGSYNTGLGYYSLGSITAASYNVGIGYMAGRYITDGATFNTTGSSSIYIGASTRPAANAETNQIVIGNSTIGNGANTVTIGNSSILRTYLRGVNLAAGTAAAGTAPLKFTSGTVLGTTEAGAIEFDGTHLYFTVANGGTRFQLDQQGGGGADALGTYLVQTATNAPANAQVMGVLGTGLVKNTTTTGVQSIAIAGTDYIAPNVAIVAATKTKITYDIRGLVTAGADATTADIAASTNKNYVTDAQLTVIGNTSGTNTGDSSGHTGLVPYTGATGAVTLGTYGFTAASTILTKADSGAATDLLINPTAKASGYFIDTQINGVTKFRVGYNGVVSLGALTPSTYQSLLIFENGTNKAGLGSAPSEMRIFAMQGTRLALGHMNTTDGSTFDYKFSMIANGNIGIGIENIVPTAKLQLPAGSTAASSAPLKFNTGALMTIAEAGAVEFLTDAYYGTITTGAARKQFAFVENVAPITGSANYIQNQNASAQTANMWISGTASVDSLGVNTSTPATKLEVFDGDITATSYRTSVVIGTGTGLVFRNKITTNTANNIASIKLNTESTAGSESGGLIFNTKPDYLSTSLVEAMRIAANGNVGIGTITPTEILTIKTTTNEESATLSGTELVNGTGWTTTGWTGSYPSFTHITGNTTPISKTVTLATYSVYQVSFTVTGRTAGGFTVGLNGQIAKSISAVYSATDKVSFKTSASSTGDLIFTPNTTFNGTISDISVQLVTASTAAAFSVYDSGNSNAFQLKPTTATQYNLFSGAGSGKYNITGSYNLGFGYDALNFNVTGKYNVAIGATALAVNTCGEYNTAVGGDSLAKNTTGYFNTAFGNSALNANTEGAYNVGLGSRSLFANTTGTTNVAIGGYMALGSNTTGSYNIGIGNGALYSNLTANYNTAIGTNSLYSTTTASNVGVGYNSGRYIANGSTANVTSTTSTYIGTSTKSLADGDANETVIGYNAIGLGDNSVSLGNSSVTKLGVGNAEVFYQPLKSGSAGTAGQILISTGSATAPTWQSYSDGTIVESNAPFNAPVNIGDMFIDTANVDIYIATGNSSSSDWTKMAKAI